MSKLDDDWKQLMSNYTIKDEEGDLIDVGNFIGDVRSVINNLDSKDPILAQASYFIGMAFNVILKADSVEPVKSERKMLN